MPLSLNDVVQIVGLFIGFCSVVASCCFLIYRSNQLQKDFDKHLEKHEERDKAIIERIKLESSLDLNKLEKEIISVVNGKYLRSNEAKQLEEEIDRRIRALEHEIHNDNGLRQRIHEIEGTVNMFSSMVKRQ